MVGLTGLEPVTLGLEGRCSIQMSYRPIAKKLVGVERFELPTSCSQSRRATRLRYTPITVFDHKTDADNTGKLLRRQPIL